MPLNDVGPNLKVSVPLESIPMLATTAHVCGLKFIVTPFAPSLVEPLRHHVDMVKISAYDLTYWDLIQAATRLDVPIILSTAMATEREVEQAWEWVRDVNREIDIIFLQGVAQYPASALNYNLRVLRRNLGRWGVSDHTLGYEIPSLAVALGACMVEKHFRTFSTSQKSPDYAHSLNPHQFKIMVKDIERTLRILGDGEKRGPLPGEMELYTTCRRTNEKPLRG